MTILSEELINDPLGRGYSGMTNNEVETDINSIYRPAPDLNYIEANIIFEFIDRTEFVALSSDQKLELQILLALSNEINISPTSKARNLLSSLFGAGTNTRTNLLNYVTNQLQSRGKELGLEYVREGHIEAVRGRI